MKQRPIVAIKGAGDLASGIAVRLGRSGFRVILSELPKPLCIRRTIAFANTVFDGKMKVENIESGLISDPQEADSLWNSKRIPVIVDPDSSRILSLKPDVLIDARIMKNYRDDIHIQDAPLVIGLGPGFIAGKNVHAVIETNRGHDLGRVLWSGEAEPDTGVPGLIKGESVKRVQKAPCDGTFVPQVEIGDPVKEGDIMATVNGKPVLASLDGIVRGVIYPGIYVEKGLKIMDIDPRGKREHCFTVSDKASAIGGAILEAILTWNAQGSFPPEC